MRWFSRFDRNENDDGEIGRSTDTHRTKRHDRRSGRGQRWQNLVPRIHADLQVIKAEIYFLQKQMVFNVSLY